MVVLVAVVVAVVVGYLTSQQQSCVPQGISYVLRERQTD